MISQYRRLVSSPQSEEYWSSEGNLKGLEMFCRTADKDALILFLLKYATGKGLEAGCGSGKYTFVLGRMGADITGLDFSEKRLECGKLQFPSIANRLVRGDLFRLPFEDKSFGWYWSPGVIEHYDDSADRRKILAEANRVLVDDGTLIVTVPYSNLAWRIFSPIQMILNVRKRHKNYTFYQYRYSIRELRKELSHAGYDLLEAKPIHPGYFARIVQRVVQKTRMHNWSITQYAFGHLLVVAARKSHTSDNRQ